MAVALNPRYKKLTFLRRAKREEVWTALSTAFRAFYDRKHRAGRPTEEKNSETRSPVPKRRTLTLLLLHIIINSQFFSVFKQINEFKTCFCEVKSLIVLAN